MSMRALCAPRSLLAVLGLGLVLPPPHTDPTSAVTRLVATRDSGFTVPDSVRALLTRVTALVSEPDSSLYVADPTLGAILHLSPSGDLRRVLGRRGSGPGEFNTVLLLGLHGDSVWAVDPAMIRLTLLPLRGRGGPLTIPLGISAATLEDQRRPQARDGMPSTVLPDGSLLVEQAVRDTVNGGAGQWKYGLLLRTTRQLEVLDTIARNSLTHTSMVFVSRDGESHFRQPFSDDPIYGVSSDGSLLVTVDREVPRRGGVGTFRVTAWRGAKERVFQREVEYTGQRLSSAAVDSAIAVYLDPRSRGGAGAVVTSDSIRRRLFRPQIFPPVEAVRVARDGSIWLKVHLIDSPDGVGDWLVLSRHGFEMYRVTLPASFRVLEANHRTVWGVEGDVLDVPLLTRYTLPDRPV